MNNPIIITGGAQRLGLAMAHNLVDQGHSVLVTYRTARDNITALHKLGIQTYQVDFAENQQIDDFVGYLHSQYTSLRAIIHNASDWASEAQTTDNAELFTRMMQIHASAPYQINLGCRSLLEASVQVADVIHMTDYVQDKGSKKHLAYAASKAALHNLTLSFSALFAPRVKVNSIAPALVMFNQDDTPEYKQKALAKSLLEICPGAEEAVKAVNYLLSSDYVTGRTLHLDGGRHLK